MRQTGIYCIRNVINGRVYVGSAIFLARRWYLHRSLLTRGIHHSVLLQRSWLKYGPDAFRFEVLELCDTEKLINREQYWIDTLNAADHQHGFNIAPKAGSSLGRKHPPEVIELMKAQRKGRKMPPRTPEHCAALSASRIGNQWGKGILKSPEHRQKLSAARTGKKMPWVAESNKRRAVKRRLQNAT